MSHSYRKQSEGDVYHVILRGNGRQILFEDDSDRRSFMGKLRRLLTDFGGDLLAWCLMSNHAHLLLHAPLQHISIVMHRFNTDYARYFNTKYERVGSLYQDRFTSVPIESDEQLIAAVKYIHMNPVKAGEQLYCDWSSYREYLDFSASNYIDRDFVLELVGGLGEFIRIHEADASNEPYLPSTTRRRMGEAEALRTAKELLGDISPYDVRTLSKEARNEKIRLMKAAGLSVRQIERITGIGRGIISRV